MAFKQSLMENKSIKLQAEAADWRTAIKLGTDMLVASGAVEAGYYDAIINCIKTMGPYIIIAPNFAMPHARPEDGVNRTAFALVTLKTPVLFDDEPEPVDVLVTLAGSTSDEHMAGLMEVIQILEDEASETGVNLAPLRLCRTENDVYQAIDNALN
ncbi:PTS system ascorbate-specific IIA component (L-Asc family) [Orbus hercynius]|uniref:Ascorbate-specific PTS system EIIA component n=1 Tax=Orbus hercynius TaxID=593135 RepID=A0A495RIH3_9GAMM|nr:PTS sugar transporter subunit IIA [Orbus hercynius]RKS87201.1 PTS system ascorbate-specific IIA component (L-Asc family) [Orbus hercynius]